MNHPPRRNPAHRRRRIHHNRFPYVRFATVRAENKRSPFSPRLLLRGDWLTEAGFLPHWRVRITVHAQRLVIEPLLGAALADPWPPSKPLTCPVNTRPQPTKNFKVDRTDDCSVNSTYFCAEPADAYMTKIVKKFLSNTETKSRSIEMATDKTRFDPGAFGITIRKKDIEGHGYFCGSVAELPDIEVFEETFQAAYEEILNIITSLKLLADEKKRTFPVPQSANDDFSGRVTLRIPKSLHRRSAAIADAEGVSLNQLFVTWIAEGMGQKTVST